MPRGRDRKRVNPEQKGLLSKIMGSVCESHKIDSATTAIVDKIFKHEGEKNESLEDLLADVISTFRVDLSWKVEPTLIPPPRVVDKRKYHKLPEYPEKTIQRIVVVTGSHELFSVEPMKAFPTNQAIFVSQGHAISMTPSHGVFSYDDKTSYDRELYPGKGFKRPEKRHLIVIDFIAENDEEFQKIQEEEIGKTNDRILKQVESPGLIESILKTLGMKA